MIREKFNKMSSKEALSISCIVGFAYFVLSNLFYYFSFGKIESFISFKWGLICLCPTISIPLVLFFPLFDGDLRMDKEMEESQKKIVQKKLSPDYFSVVKYKNITSLYQDKITKEIISNFQFEAKLSKDTNIIVIAKDKNGNLLYECSLNISSFFESFSL